MRTTAVRFVLAFLLAFLLAPHSGDSTAEAAAHEPALSLREDRAQGASAGEALSEYGGTCGTLHPGSDPNGLLRPRDRHRSAGAPVPEAPSRAAVAGSAGHGSVPAAGAGTGAAAHSPRPSTAHSSSVLQVFRC
ncbi:hypothetical protein AB0D35_21205 [Streptomyces sp. NPDC048301]|uniref:hypothetical protein n=1 Tax=unclassified Streptomyces TaxID=2593676 RepID=UPI00342037F2